jgi:undecaprenyl-diphosphatase
LTVAAADLTALGSIAVLGVVVLIVGGLFAAVGRTRQAIVLIVASVGAVIWSQGLKMLFDRSRPDDIFHAVEVVNSSFPSGHAMLSASVYLTLGALAWRFSSRLKVRVYALAAAISVTLIVGLSRVFLGVHWPTDVLAGWCVGTAWALGCWLVEGLWERRHGRP